MRSLLLGLLLLTPLPAEENLAGRELFQTHCLSCHGPDGRGDGPAAASLEPPPRDLHQRPYKYGCCANAVYRTITSGVADTAMPSFEGVLTEQQRRSLAEYVSRLGRP